MAYEMWRLMDEADLLQQRILIMAGHQDGILVFGPTLPSAAQVLERVLAPGNSAPLTVRYNWLDV